MKVLGNKISSKKASIIGNFWGTFEKPHSYVKTAWATFWATFGKNWATFSPTSGHTTNNIQLHICREIVVAVAAKTITIGTYLGITVNVVTMILLSMNEKGKQVNQPQSRSICFYWLKEMLCIASL